MKSGIFCWLYMLNFKFLLHNSIIYHIFDKNKNDMIKKVYKWICKVLNGGKKTMPPELGGF